MLSTSMLERNETRGIWVMATQERGVQIDFGHAGFESDFFFLSHLCGALPRCIYEGPHIYGEKME